MITLIKNIYKKLSLIIKIDNELNLFLVINNEININIGNIFDFKYSKLNYVIECNVEEYYSILNWMDDNDNYIYIINYFEKLQFNKEILRKIKLMKIYEK